MDLRAIQAVARARGLYESAIDGVWGPASRDACLALILEQHVNAREWSRGRLTVGAGQAICRMLGIDAGPVDGFPGPQTRHAFAVLAAREAAGSLTGTVPEAETWRDREAGAEAAPAPSSARGNWPAQSAVSGFFGPIGSGQTTLELPYRMRLAWDLGTEVARISCHRLVAPAFRRVFARSLAHYGYERIVQLRLDRFGGCLNVRKMRGGSAWSMHAWGIAIDIDPERNQLRWGRDRAELAKPAYQAFWGFVADEGLVSLGRERNYDWMHFQAARL